MNFLIPVILDLLAAPLSAFGSYLIGHGVTTAHEQSLLQFIQNSIPGDIMLLVGLFWGFFRIPAVHARLKAFEDGLSIPYVHLPPNSKTITTNSTEIPPLK